MTPTDFVLQAFGLAELDARWERLTGGHIHATWLATLPSGPRFVAQSINTSVFQDIDACERNLDQLDLLMGGSLVPRLLRTSADRIHWVGPDETVWRVSEFAEATVGATTVTSTAQACDAARLFGRFANTLRNCAPETLARPIPRFHDLAWRLHQLQAATRDDPSGRVTACRELLARIRDLAGFVALPQGLTTRIVHNDAKVANVRFDSTTGAAAMIVDLDTTMAGALAFDVGELVRSGATTGAEDDEQAEIDLERVGPIIDGYLEGAGPMVTGDERASFGRSGALMALENATRMLTDHLLGDVYFAIAYSGHNLHRARAQLRLAEELSRHHG